MAVEAPVAPPKAWFENPRLERPTPLTLTSDGHLFGHLATWNSRHIGMQGQNVSPPRSKSQYGYFRTGLIETEEGDSIPVGQFTLSGGHADLRASASEAARHYDETRSAFADVAAGEDSVGIWFSGALRPGLGELKERVIRSSALSGDWRPINGALELVAACSVNTPGFPIARQAIAASGELTALVAAGTLDLALAASGVGSYLLDMDARLTKLELRERVRINRKVQ